MALQIRTPDELRQALRHKLYELKEETGADVVTLHLYDSERDRLYFPVGVGLLQEARFMRSMPAMERVAGKLVHLREHIVAEEAERHPDVTGPFTYAERVKSAAGFPLLVPDSGEVIGTLFVDYRQVHKFDPGEVEHIKSRAVEIAKFVKQSFEGETGRRLRDALRRESDLRLKELRLQEIIERLWEILGDVDVALWTRERGERVLRIRVYKGFNSEFVDNVSVDLDADKSNLIAIAFTSGKEVFIKDPVSDPRAIFKIKPPLTWGRMLAEPIFSEYHRLGVLSVFRRSNVEFTSQEQEFIRAFARLSAVRIENEERIIALKALHDLGVRLTRTSAPQELGETLQEIVRSACQILGADIATVHRYDAVHRRFYDLEHSAVYPPAAREGMERPRDEGGLSARIIEQGRVYYEDVDAEAKKDPFALSTFVEKQGIKAYVGTPLKSLDEPVGVMYVSFKEKRRFSPEDLALIQILANYASAAIHNARIYATLENRVQELQALQDFAGKIASSLDTDEIMRAFLHTICDILDFDFAQISLVDEVRGIIETKHSIWKGELDAFPEWRELSRYSLKDKDILPYIVNTGKTEIIAGWDERFNPEIYNKYREIHDRLIRVFMPIKVVVREENSGGNPTEKVIGTIEAGYDMEHKDQIDENEVRILQAFVDQMAISLYNADLFERLQRNAQSLAVLNRVGQALTQGIRLREEEILELIHQQASALMDTSNMYIALYDEATDTIRFGLAFVDGKRIDVKKEPGWQPRTGGKGRTEYIIRIKEPLLHKTKKEAEEWYEQPGHEEYIGKTFASWIGVPMMAGARVIGVIATYHPEEDFLYSEEDVEILQTLANQAAIALDNARLFYDINQRLEALIEVGQVITSRICIGEEEILELLHKQAQRLMDTDNMYIALYDEKTDTVRFGLAFVDGKRIDVEKEPGWQPRRGGKGKTEYIINTRQPLLHRTQEEAKSWYQRPGHEEYTGGPIWASWLGVPMVIGDKVLGVIATYHPTRDYVYDENDLKILQALANQAAIALENARLFEAEKKWAERLEALHEVTRELTASLDPEHVWSLILEKAVQLTGAHCGTLRLVDEEKQELVLHLVHPLEAMPEDETLKRMPLGYGITGWVAKHKKPRLVEDVTKEEQYVRFLKDTKSELAVPLIINGRVIGVLNVEHKEVGGLDEQDLKLLSSFASQAVVAIQNAQRYKEREEALKALREEQTRRIAAEKWKTLGQATANLAHRMNNLAGIIPVCVQRIRKRITPDDVVTENLDTIEQQAKYLLQLSEDLLKPFTPSEEGVFNVKDLMKEALAITRPQLDERGVQVTVLWGEELPKIRIRRLLTDVFVELITNAVKAMPEGGDLTVEFKRSNKTIEISFTDTGCGISPEKREKIFELFSGEKRPSDRGVGFGLWWVRTFLQQWGGDVDLVWSEVGKGSTFRITLPVEE